MTRKYNFEKLQLHAGQAVANAGGKLQQEYYVLEQGIYQVEVLDNLDKLLPTGALISIAYLNWTEATGSPVRAIAYVFENDVTD